MNKLNWQVKLLGLITLVLSVLLLFQLLYTIPYIKNRDVEMTKIHQEEVARNIARELEIDLVRIVDRLERIAERTEFRDMDIDSQNITMVQHEEISKLLHSISVLDAEGWFVSSTIDDLSMFTTKSYADQNYFRVPFEQGTQYFAPPRYYSTSGIVNASVSVPIESYTGERAGVLMGGLRLNEIIERVANYPLEEGMIAFVVDSEGTLVAHSEIDIFALDDGPLSLDYSNQPLVQAVMAGERDCFEEHEHEDDVPYFGSYTILETNGWGVVVETPISVILADSERLSGRLLAINLVLFIISLSTTLVFARQITAEQMQAEKALRVSEDRLKLALEASNSGIWEFNPLTFTNAHYNDTWFTMLGYEPDEFPHTTETWVKLLHPEDVEETQKKLQHHIEGMSEYSCDFRMKAKSNDYRWIHADGKIILWDNDGHPQRMIGIHTDITERKQAEEEKRQMEVHLRQQQKLESIGTLAGGVAHEINNPIMGIMNYAQLIYDRLDPAESRLREFSAGIIEETERVAEIVRNLLTFSRQEKQTHSPARMTDIVNDTLPLIRTIIKRDQITLQVDVPDDLPEIKCRSQQIQQVLMNLLTNARDALNQRYPEYDPDKVVTLTVRPFEKEGRRWLRTTVEDHGRGIPVEIREHIFDPFYTTKDRAIGTGLGLSISLGIVQDHHGELTFESVENQFTRFYLDLPLDNGWDL